MSKGENDIEKCGKEEGMGNVGVFVDVLSEFGLEKVEVS